MSAAAATTSSPFPEPAKVGLKLKKALGDRKEGVTGDLKKIATAAGIDAITWDGETDVGILVAQSAADSSNTKLSEYLNGDIGSRTQSMISSLCRGVEHQCKDANVKKALGDAWTSKKLQLRWTKNVATDVEPGSAVFEKGGVSFGMKDGILTLYTPLADPDKTKHSEVYFADLLTNYSAMTNPGATGLDLKQKKEYAYRGPYIEDCLKAIAKEAGVDKITWDYDTDIPAMLTFKRENPGLLNEQYFADSVIDKCGSIIGGLKDGLTHQFKDAMIKEAFVDAVTNKKIVIKIVKDVETEVSKESSGLTAKKSGAVQIKDGNFVCYQNAKDWGTADHRTVKIENLL